MIIYIKNARKDNKAIVSYRFDNGKVINKLLPLDKIPTLIIDNPTAEFVGNTQLLNSATNGEFRQSTYEHYDSNNQIVSKPMFSLDNCDIVQARPRVFLVRINNGDLCPTIDYWTPKHYEIAQHFKLLGY